MNSKKYKESPYTDTHARAGKFSPLPAIECFPNQYPGYVVTIEDPEFTSVCPKTGLPDFGTITLRYMPLKSCVELKSLKYYMNAYRGLGIFQENVVNRVLRDVVTSCRPKWAVVVGAFRARGGLTTTVEARYGRPAWEGNHIK